MKKHQSILIVLLIAAACGAGGYSLYKQQQAAYEGGQRPSPISSIQQASYENGDMPRAPENRSQPFSARTRFRILQSPAPDIFGSQTAEQQKQMNANWLQTQAKAVASPDVLMRALKRLNLEAKWKLTAEQVLTRLRRNMNVSVADESDVVSVTVWGYAETTCGDVANAVRDAYEEFRNEMEEERFRRLTQYVETQLKTQEDLVNARKAEEDALQKKQGIAAAPPQPQPQPQPGYASGLRQIEPSIMMLNTLRELAAHQKVLGGTTRKTIETLEVAQPALR